MNNHALNAISVGNARNPPPPPPLCKTRQPRTAIYTSEFHQLTETCGVENFPITGSYPTMDTSDSLLSNRGPYPITFSCRYSKMEFYELICIGDHV